jgi:ribonuclease H-related protein
MVKKWYALKLRNGRRKFLYGTWDEASSKILGKKGIVYKGFSSEEETVAWTEQGAIPFRTIDTEYEKDAVYLFVDGSYSSVRKCAGWGWVAIKNDEKLNEDWGCVENLEGARNVIGELAGAMSAISWAVDSGIKEVVVVHDYAGIGTWALGYWNANSEIAKDYVEFITSIKERINLRFEKVNGHCEIKWNEYADELTRRYQIRSKDLYTDEVCESN